ncbi:TonB dependent receptor [Dyadobacter arcticus]|uniref:Outer membrane receptor protein involved in Fe transport n=1 Tax=Dyadobacter arcticus TaxID=1078754 RepID=A0ABX0UI11_9BACT|nr:TonB dependent receptor [Dyadobacter arcticus]NIJ52651.1 outer membrane receptor protein involved in Fe transport [Dyadobacter arcticus]
MARFTTLLFFFFTALSLNGQSISGSVIDEAQRPASFSVVKLLKTTDSTLVKGTIANEAGEYEFTGISEGTYYVKASLVGMLDKNSSLVTLHAGQSVRLDPLMMIQAQQALNELVVQARTPNIEQQVDKTVLNIAADQVAQGKTAYELLQQAPGVMIDPNDNIRMGGKQGVNVFIDGKPTNLSSIDLANLLRATAASNIDKIELISNPSARFDAQGGAGVINIRLRRNKNYGLNGNVSGGYGQSDHYRANLALDLNYRAKRLSLYGNASGSDNYQITKVLLDRNANGLQFVQRGFDTDGTRAVVYKTGIDYSLSTRQTIGLVVAGNAAFNRFGTNSGTSIINSKGQVDSSIVNRVFNPNHNNRINVALTYRYADTLGLELNADADFTHFSNDSPSNIVSNYISPDGLPLFNRLVRFEAYTGIRIGTIRADVVKEWKKKQVKLETGLKHTNVATVNNLLAFSGADDQPDVNRTNRFTYREIVSAAYASLNRSNGKWSMQAGVRAERTAVHGRSVDRLSRVIDRPDTTYFNLFPTGYIQYQISGNGQLGLNYGRRIGRPSYQDLNPFIYQIDPYTSQRGNPFLMPSYTHNAELSYTYKWATNVKLSYGHTDGFSTDVMQQQGLIAYQTVANVGQVNALNVSLSTPYEFTKWWSTYLYAAATWNRFQGNFSTNEIFDQQAFAFESYVQNTFSISKSWQAQVSGFWNAPTTQTVYRIGSLGALNLSIERKVLKGQGKLALNVDDLFNTMRWRQSASFESQRFNINRKWESRRVSIRFAYRFGRSEIKGAREPRTDTDASRIRTKGNL